MQQSRTPTRERRRQPRSPKAFAFWVRPVTTGRRIGAWMLNTSEGGAAFLAPTAEAPPIGQRIQLIEMPTRSRLVREDAGPLPPFARVVRHDEVDGITRRVAVQFETDMAARLRPERHATTRTMLREPTPVVLAPPAFVTSGSCTTGP